MIWLDMCFEKKKFFNLWSGRGVVSMGGEVGGWVESLGGFRK